MDIAYWLLTLVILVGVWRTLKRWTLRLSLTPILLVGSGLLWAQVVAPRVPPQWQYLGIEKRVAWITKKVPALTTYARLLNPAQLKKDLANDVKNLVEMDANGERQISDETKKKYSNVKVPTFMEKDFNAMKGKVQTQQAENSSLEQAVKAN